MDKSFAYKYGMWKQHSLHQGLMMEKSIVFEMLDTNSMLTQLITCTDLTVFCSLFMLMILLQEIQWPSHDDSLLYVRLQHYEPIFVLQKKLHFVRNWRSKVTSGDNETKTTLPECELHICQKSISLASTHAHVTL